MILISRNKVEKETEFFLVEGDDLPSLLIPLLYVTLPFLFSHIRLFQFFHNPLSLLLYYTRPNLDKKEGLPELDKKGISDLLKQTSDLELTPSDLPKHSR
jgi:hypothetical protein